MDIDLIRLYAYELHWHLPEAIQKEAMEWLTEKTPRDQLALVFPPYSKSCWQNSMKVIEAIGYPANKAAFPRMVKLFQDCNWPGAEEAVLYFQTLEKAIVMPYIEAGGKQAIIERDEEWLWFLFVVCERLQMDRADFQNKSVFDAMKEIYERDA
ncbi:MAG TPA: hypothetical protein VIH12_02760 [Solibacillus sp.]